MTVFRPMDQAYDPIEEYSQHDELSFNDVHESLENSRGWFMEVMEETPIFPEGYRITGQFTPQQVTQNMGSKIPDAGGFSRRSPIIQWVGGQLQTFSFQARLFSMNSEDDTAEAKLANIEYLMREHPNLARPPLVSFFWGSIFPEGFPCFVESLGGISYDEVRDDGTLRGVTLSITLKKFTQFVVEQSPVSQERTPVHIAKHGETYEMIAQKHYGDPLLGVLLRQRNPRSPMVENAPESVADLKPGDEVKIYPIFEMKQEDIKPLCHVLRQDSFESMDNRKKFFDKRSTLTAVMPRK